MQKDTYELPQSMVPKHTDDSIVWEDEALQYINQLPLNESGRKLKPIQLDCTIEKYAECTGAIFMDDFTNMTKNIEHEDNARLTSHEIIFDGKDVVSINIKKHIVRDINGQCDKLPHLYMPTNWRHIPKGKTYNDIIFAYRYCAQYESMLCNCIDNDMKTIRGKVRVSEIPVSYWTYDENFKIVKVCMLHNGFCTALGKLTSISETHYEAQGFSYYEPYYGTYSKKIRFNGDKCTITFRPLKSNNHGYYGSYLTHDIPLFNNKDAVCKYVQWFRDDILNTQNRHENTRQERDSNVHPERL